MNLLKSNPRYFLMLGLLPICMGTPSVSMAQNATTNSDTSATTTPSLETAAHLYATGKLDEALTVISAVLQTEPKNLNAYIVRGAIYSQKQMWDEAEKDYQAALQIDPTNKGLPYDLADLKFKQKKFDDARAAFSPLQDAYDTDVNDLIKYKIFICDLYGEHPDLAEKELAAFNAAGKDPSYYFSNAASSLFNKKTEEGRTWLISASHIYPARKQLLYASILKTMGYLPLPAPPEQN